MHHIQIFGRIQQTVVWHRNGIWKKNMIRSKVPEGIYTIQTALSSSKNFRYRQWF